MNENLFSFSQKLIFVPHRSNQYIHSWLKSLFKTKAVRSSMVHSDRRILTQLNLELLHPFIVRQFESDLITDRQRSLRLAEGTNLTQPQYLSFFHSISRKINGILELLHNVQLTVVIGFNFAILRMIMVLLRSLDIPCAVLNSNYTSERAQEAFLTGVLLMTRKIDSPLLDHFQFDQIIFYDIDFSFPEELDLIRFLTRER
jgi:hypothetical protein